MFIGMGFVLEESFKFRKYSLMVRVGLSISLKV